MYNLYEHLPDGKQLLLGEYGSIPECQRAVAIRWDIMQKLGYVKAEFHCERAETGERLIAWGFDDEEEIPIWR